MPKSLARVAGRTVALERTITMRRAVFLLLASAPSSSSPAAPVRPRRHSPGRLDAFSENGTHLIVDAFGYFSG